MFPNGEGPVSSFSGGVLRRPWSNGGRVRAEMCMWRMTAAWPSDSSFSVRWAAVGEKATAFLG